VYCNIANAEKALDQCIEDCAHEEIDASHVRKYCRGRIFLTTITTIVNIHTCNKCEWSNIVVENTKG
jgi:hypothetical protein